jgi:hypothetical protein
MFVEPCLLSSSEVMLVSDNMQFFLAQSYSKCFSVVHALVIRDWWTMISSLCHSNLWTSSFWHECVHEWFGKDWLNKVRFDFVNLSAETWWAWKIDWLCTFFRERSEKIVLSNFMLYSDAKMLSFFMAHPLHYLSAIEEIVHITLNEKTQEVRNMCTPPWHLNFAMARITGHFLPTTHM